MATGKFLSTNGSLGGHLTSSSVFCDDHQGFSIAFSWVGTAPVGTLTVENSADDSTYAAISGISKSISGNSGSIMLHIEDVVSKYVHVVYTRVSGTGTANVIYFDSVQPENTFGPALGTDANESIFLGDVSCVSNFVTQPADVASAATITNLSCSKSLVNLTGTTATTLNSIVAGKPGQHLWLLNLTTDVLTIKHELGGETAANKITTLTGSDVVTTGNGAAHFIYDGTTSKWICMSASL
mgnify:CR=1 FL=1